MLHVNKRQEYGFKSSPSKPQGLQLVFDFILWFQLQVGL